VRLLAEAPAREPFEAPYVPLWRACRCSCGDVRCVVRCVEVERPIGSYAPVSPHALGGMGSGRRVLPGVNIEHSFVGGTEQVYGSGGRSLTQPT